MFVRKFIGSLLVIGWCTAELFAAQPDAAAVSAQECTPFFACMEGCWYPIARTTADRRDKLGDVRLVYHFREDGSFDLRVEGVDGLTGKTVRIVRQGRMTAGGSDLKIVACDPGHRWAVVETGRHLWILAREPQLPVPTLNRTLRIARREGFDTERLHFVDQRRTIEALGTQLTR
ncbi:MAG: lipocalin family protein [Alistipes sp.]|nr:lipocalin family protein [Alistipes sp.]